MHTKPASALPKSQRRILELLSDGQLWSYRDIVLATGKYSNLPGELRSRHERSLGAKGLIRESFLTIERSKVAVFQIVPMGCRVIGVPVPKTLMTAKVVEANFKERYRQWCEQYEQEERIAKAIGLRHNPYLLLKSLGDGQEHTFADLAQATGIFSGLVQDLRLRHTRHGSLASMGLVKETVIEGDRKATFAFQITNQGLALLDKAKKIR